MPVIPEGSLVALDTVSLIYFLEQHEHYGEMADAVFQRIETGELRGVMSSLVFAELLVPMYQAGDSESASGLKNTISNFRNLEIIPMTIAISVRAAQLRAEYNLRTPDSIHAATAVLTNADGMLTNDKKLNRLEDENLKIWQFDELLEKTH